MHHATAARARVHHFFACACVWDLGWFWQVQSHLAAAAAAVSAATAASAASCSTSAGVSAMPAAGRDSRLLEPGRVRRPVTGTELTPEQVHKDLLSTQAELLLMLKETYLRCSGDDKGVVYGCSIPIAYADRFGKDLHPHLHGVKLSELLWYHPHVRIVGDEPTTRGVVFQKTPNEVRVCGTCTMFTCRVLTCMHGAVVYVTGRKPRSGPAGATPRRSARCHRVRQVGRRLDPLEGLRCQVWGNAGLELQLVAGWDHPVPPRRSCVPRCQGRRVAEVEGCRHHCRGSRTRTRPCPCSCTHPCTCHSGGTRCCCCARSCSWRWRWRCRWWWWCQCQCCRSCCRRKPPFPPLWQCRGRECSSTHPVFGACRASSHRAHPRGMPSLWAAHCRADGPD